MRKGKERRLDMQQHHDEMIKRSTNERAKKWFNRPAYSIRGDTIGQAKTESVQSSAERNTKTQ